MTRRRRTTAGLLVALTAWAALAVPTAAPPASAASAAATVNAATATSGDPGDPGDPAAMPVPAPEPVPSGAAAGDQDVVELVVDGADSATDAAPARLAAAVAAVGGQLVGDGTGSVLLARLPTTDAAAVAVVERAGATVREPRRINVPLQATTATTAAPAYGTVPGDSAAAIGALAWQEAGYDGAGVRIGVIDYFNQAFWHTDEMGPMPTAADGHAFCRDAGTDCIATFTASPTDDGQRHGPAIVEVIRDVAPAADVYLATAETYQDYLEVIDWFAANGVTVISRSLGTLIDGPGDGTGPTDELADYAAAKGIVWVNAAGNEAAGGYWRDEDPTIDDDGYVVFHDAQGTPFSELPIQGGCTVAALRWSDWGEGDPSDYTLELYRRSGGSPVLIAQGERPEAGQPLLQLPVGPSACPGAGAQLTLRVRRTVAGAPDDADVLEILDYQGGIASGFHQAPYSATLPAADSANPLVLAVGAVDPVAGTAIGYYSSQGPTNEGLGGPSRIKPDLVAPAGVQSSVYAGGFSGTSAAAPAVAAAAALLLQAGLAAPGAPLAALLRSTVTPLGEPTPNNVYGAGLLHLGAPPDVTPTAYHPLAEPLRVLDTRPTGPVGPADLVGRFTPGTLLDIPLADLLGRDPTELRAVALNLTVVDAVAPGWVQLLPTAKSAVGAFSNLNVDAAGQTRGNVVLVPVGDGGRVSLYLGSGGSAILDVLGTYDVGPAEVAAGRLLPLDPTRLLDTRPASRVGAAGTGPDGALRRGEAVCVDAAAAGIPADATVEALVLTVTATAATATGFVQALPTGGTPGASSTLNVGAGDTVANSTIVPLGGPCGTSPHSVSLYFDGAAAAASTHLVVDVTGAITGDGAGEAAAGMFVPVTPGRLLDTRPTPMTTGATRTVQVAAAPGVAPAVPVGASGVAVNLTATGTRGWGYLSAWPAGGTVPATSNLNWTHAGVTIANGGILKLSAGGALDLRSTTPTSTLSADHLLDVTGYFT